MDGHFPSLQDWWFRMQRLLVLLLSLGLVTGQDYLQRKCNFIKREMQGGHKAWMKHQGWYKRLAKLCNLPMPEEPQGGSLFPMQMQRPSFAMGDAAPGMRPMQSHPGLHIEVPSQVSGGLRNALGWAKQAASSPAGEELKDDAKKLAEKAKTAFEHQDSQELKEGAAEFMKNMKNLWEKNTDEETKKKAAVLMGRAQQLLSGKGEDLATGLKIAKMAEKKVEEQLPQALQAKDLLKAALEKPETRDVAKKVFEKIQHSGFSAEQAEELAEKAKEGLEKYGAAVHV